MPNIVVIGYVTHRKCLDVYLTIPRAGVSGLTTALLLSKDPGYKVTILAKHMPGDYDIGESVPSCCEFIIRLNWRNALKSSELQKYVLGTYNVRRLRIAS